MLTRTCQARELLGLTSDDIFELEIDDTTGIARSGKSARVDFNRFSRGTSYLRSSGPGRACEEPPGGTRCDPES